ncbi:MAG: NAD(P)/FAD-dependent oxidoreductase [Deltaproteobacteria bacterium]|nr:NAD(P)/FAD-dependent oxidoreductase [Deltaproteobacteria bacterium]
MTDENTSQPGKKSVPWNKKGDGRTKYDVIVIGSGMGGMCAAAMLAKLGKQVLVVEQHFVPGGFTHTFKRKGYTWDVGVHAVGEVTAHSMTGRLLAKLTDGRLKWASLGPVYDSFHFPDDVNIDFPDHPDAFRDNLIAAFPQEKSAIDEYLIRIREVADAMKLYYLARVGPRRLAPITDRIVARKANGFLQERTADVIASLTDNLQLRAVMAAQWGYYGSPPSRSSFAMQALVVKHFMHGGYYPVGGSEQIAKELLQTVANAGGWTRVHADVDEVIIRNQRACGVRLKNGEELLAEKVISAAGVSQTVRKLLPDSLCDKSWVHDVRRLKPASAHVCLYVGFKGNIREAGASATNQWFYNTWNMEAEDWDVRPDTPLKDADCLYVSFPSLKDPEHDAGDEQRHTGEVVTFVPFKAFASWTSTQWKRRPEDYDAFKKQLEEKLLAQLLKKMPQLAPFVDYVELSTPLSTDHFCRPTMGSIYGLEPTPERFSTRWLRPKSPVDGLYFAGSEVTTVGVMGAMMGGVLSVVAAFPKEGLGLLREE